MHPAAQPLPSASEDSADSVAAGPSAVTSEEAGRAGPPAVLVPAPDDGTAAMELLGLTKEEFLDAMCWLQTLHEDEAAEDWLVLRRELDSECPKGGPPTHACP